MPDGGRRPFHRARLRYDPTFAAELGYCFDKGLPHSFLLGDVLRWTDEDRDKLAAYMAEQGQRCNMCGTAQWEWEENRYAYEAVIEYCHGCSMKDTMREEANTPGSSITLVPPSVAAKMRETKRKIPGRRRNKEA